MYTVFFVSLNLVSIVFFLIIILKCGIFLLRKVQYNNINNFGWNDTNRNNFEKLQWNEINVIIS